MEALAIFWGYLQKTTAKPQICHAFATATRVNQGVEPWVLQQPLASCGDVRNERFYRFRADISLRPKRAAMTFRSRCGRFASNSVASTSLLVRSPLLRPIYHRYQSAIWSPPNDGPSSHQLP